TTTPAPSGNKLIGAKNTPVTIKLKMNKTATATATFYVTAGRLKKQITLIPRLNQLKYVSTTSLTIPQGGGNPVTDLTMKFTGEYAGSFNVNAYVGATPVGTYSDSNKDTHPVRVDPNETWSARTVKFTYSGVNLPEQAIPDTRSQSGYNITGTGINNTSIPWNGHNYSITITGDYPTGVLIYAVKKGTNTLVSNEVGAIPTTVLAIEPNLDNATRALEIRAKHTDMLTPGYLKLKETNLTQNHRPITFTYNSATYAVVEMYNQSSQNILATNRVPTFTLSSYVPEGYTLVTENSTIRSALITFVTTNNGYALNNNTQSVKTVNYTVFGILFVDNNTAISTTPKSSGAREIETNSGIHFGNDGNFSQFWSDGGNTGMWLINGASTNYTHIKFYIVVRKNS
ncbi:MAG: hypothetical protein LBQ78_03370, partial [Tannerellaceae bacterium]|nr:hypothetical protein [Tannerellaceae bacterium]